MPYRLMYEVEIRHDGLGAYRHIRGSNQLVVTQKAQAQQRVWDEDFENLIRELFEKVFSVNGGEVKITQASRDGGVDAIAFDPDPIRGGKIIIQAKRYTNTVGLSAVRDLYGPTSVPAQHLTPASDAVSRTRA